MGKKKTKNEFAPFEDLLEEGEIPIHGWRIVTTMTSEGRESITWYESGNPDIDTAIAALERTQFLMQIRDWETHREVLITDIAEDEQEEDEEELEDEEDA